jgi:hypothetical protein
MHCVYHSLDKHTKLLKDIYQKQCAMTQWLAARTESFSDLI